MARQLDTTTTELYPPLKEWVSEKLIKDFREVVHLTTIESQNDPPDNPFKSLYAARELLTGLRAKMDTCPVQNREHEDFKILSSLIQLELGVNYINTEELAQGEACLEACLRLVDGLANKVKTASLSIQALNHLGVLWGNRGEQQKALECLLKAKAVYESHVALPPPLTDTEWLLGDNADGEQPSEWEREKAFESHHTLTLFYLAQVYGHLDQPRLSAQYCQTTLSRQLESQEYDPVEWSLNCATLSQYYMSSGNYAQARHCLAAASCVLQHFKMEECGILRSETTGEEEERGVSAADEEMGGGDRMAERVLHTEADVARCWVKYCLSLLTASQRGEGEGDDGGGAEGSSGEGNSKGEEGSEKGSEGSSEREKGESGRRRGSKRMRGGSSSAEGRGSSSKAGRGGSERQRREKLFKFDTLEVADIESSLPCDLIESYQGAKPLFLVCEKHLGVAKQYYTLESHASEYMKIIQDHSSAYKLLAHFEPANELKCRMHKRRIDMLSTLQEELNPQYYLDEHRELMHEIAQAQAEMADLKIVSASDTPTPHALAKINKLLLGGIKTYERFVASFYDLQTRRLPAVIDPDYLRPILCSKLNIARLYSKIISSDPATQVWTYS